MALRVIIYTIEAEKVGSSLYLLFPQHLVLDHTFASLVHLYRFPLVKINNIFGKTSTLAKK